MHARLALAFALLLSGHALAAGSTDQARTIMGPTGTATGQGASATAWCDRYTPVSPSFCSHGGNSAIFDVQELEDGYDSHYAVGTCSVGQFQGAPPGSFVCGTDRDDDGLVTNVDALSSDPDLYDDDFTEPTARGQDAPLCFRRDVALADHDWDRWVVFVLSNSGQTSATAFYNARVTAVASVGCDGDVSGHCHGDYHGGHATGATADRLTETSMLSITGGCQ